jgi:drug/metabolite transporter (DMT)-like permease
MVFAAILFGLLAAISFGFSDFWAAKVAKRFGGYATSILVICVALLCYGLLYVLFLSSYTDFDRAALLYAAASGLAFAVGSVVFYKALEYGPVNIVSPLGSLYPLITLALLVAAFGSAISGLQGLGAIVVVGGAAVASGLLDKSSGKRRIGKGPLFGLIAAVAWGFAFAFIAQSINRIGWQFPTLIELAVEAVALLLLAPLLNRLEPGLYPKLLKGLRSPIVWVAGLLIELAFWSITFGLDYASDYTAVIVAVSACYPALTAFLAIRHLKEDFQFFSLMGAFVAVFGIIILSLG